MAKAEVLFLSTLILAVDMDLGEQYLDQVFRGLGLETDTVPQAVNELLNDWRNHERKNKQKNYTPAERLLTVMQGWEYFRSAKTFAASTVKGRVKWKEGRDKTPAIPFGARVL